MFMLIELIVYYWSTWFIGLHGLNKFEFEFEIQAGRQSDGGWCLELRRGGRYGGEDVVEF